MKVGKEEIMGCLAAVEAWMHMDLNVLNREWNARVQRIAKLVESVPGVTTEIKIPEGGNRYPTLTVNWDEKAFGLSVADCDKQLRDGEPRIEVLTASNPSLVPAVQEGKPNPKAPQEPKNQLQVISMTMQPGEDIIVGKRLREILNDARKHAGKSS
jgi:L-seryl-tRNA(Ser) seleniumtransferase